jgi:hypothetical protein
MARALNHFQRQQKVREAITAELQALRPSFGVSSPEKVQAHMELFTNSLAATYEFEATDNGEIILYRDGARVENQQGYRLSLAQVVRQEAQAQYELFAKDSPVGNVPGQTLRFRDSQDYIDRFYGAKSHEERTRLVKAWQDQSAQ